MKQVIFDTDIGIDDAMALLFLHYAPDVSIRAIVTGFGNASIEHTTRNALHMKERFGIDAPVYRGAAGPLGDALGEGYPDFVHGKNGLGDIDVPDPAGAPDTRNAAQAIVDIVRENPGQVSIVAVGRMTNVAEALALEPDLPNLVGELIVMGGAFGFNGHRGNVSPVAEANIAGDPRAADIVFSCGMPTTIVGLDVTNETIMTSAYLDELRDTAGAAGEFLHAISRYYLAFNERSTGRFECSTHDPSAVAYLLNPGLFKTRDAAVRVATEGVAIGQTIWSAPNPNYFTTAWKDIPACKICTGVDSEALLDLYRDTLLRAVQ